MNSSTKESMRHSAEEWFGAEDVVLTFIANAICNNHACKEIFALSGTGSVEVVGVEAPGGGYVTDYENSFTVRHCHPTLKLIALPNNCPQQVSSAIEAAFAVYWIDRTAAAGRIRVATECLLDHLGIAGEAKNGTRISLHHRIENFTKTNPAIGAQLMALKWLGNAGSHADAEVNTDDLLDAFAILEYVLEEVVGNKSKTMAETAAALHAKFGK